MEAIITAGRVREAVLSLPEMAAWPQVVRLFPDTPDPVRLDWLLPALACEAAGGDQSMALPAVASIACLQISIILVDDILDLDPRGEYRKLGYGPAANLALAFEAAALALIEQATVDAGRRAAAVAAIARAALRTALGQDLDVQNLRGEENYWRVVKAKSTPFYGSALQVGGLLGGADPVSAQGLYDLGVLLGEMIQILDDLFDAFAVPANADWLEGRNNLALLYATDAEHAQRQRFLGLLPEAGDAVRLAEAQQILIDSGAVSYCLYLVLKRYEAASLLLEGLSLEHKEPLSYVLKQQVAPLASWLRARDIAVPFALQPEVR